MCLPCLSLLLALLAACGAAEAAARNNASQVYNLGYSSLTERQFEDAANCTGGTDTRMLWLVVTMELDANWLTEDSNLLKAGRRDLINCAAATLATTWLVHMDFNVWQWKFLNDYTGGVGMYHLIAEPDPVALRLLQEALPLSFPCSGVYQANGVITSIDVATCVPGGFPDLVGLVPLLNRTGASDADTETAEAMYNALVQGNWGFLGQGEEAGTGAALYAGAGNASAAAAAGGAAAGAPAPTSAADVLLIYNASSAVLYDLAYWQQHGCIPTDSWWLLGSVEVTPSPPVAGGPGAAFHVNTQLLAAALCAIDSKSYSPAAGIHFDSTIAGNQAFIAREFPTRPIFNPSTFMGINNTWAALLGGIAGAAGEGPLAAGNSSAGPGAPALVVALAPPGALPNAAGAAAPDAGAGAGDSDDDDAGGMSAGAKAGVLTAIVTVALLVPAAGFFAWRRRRQRRAARAGGDGGGGAWRSTSNNSEGSEGSGAISPWLIAYKDLKLEKRLGDGSYGVVYKASWQGAPVAVKQCLFVVPDLSYSADRATFAEAAAAAAATAANGSTPVGSARAGGCGGPLSDADSESLVSSLQREAVIMAGLRHPNCVLYLGYCVDPPCLVMEYCMRGSLWDVLQDSNERPGWQRRLDMALGAALGMQYLHSREPPVLHRDLKSANLLVSESWTVKVSDFGLSRLSCDVVSNAPAGKTLAAVLPANPRFLAPEVIAGGPFSMQSDVYAFGIVLWEQILTLDMPWAGLGIFQIAALITAGGRPPLPPREDCPGFGCYKAYTRLTEDCWRQDPARRPSFEEVCERLSAMKSKLQHKMENRRAQRHTSNQSRLSLSHLTDRLKAKAFSFAQTDWGGAAPARCTAAPAGGAAAEAVQPVPAAAGQQRFLSDGDLRLGPAMARASLCLLAAALLLGVAAAQSGGCVLSADEAAKIDYSAKGISTNTTQDQATQEVMACIGTVAGPMSRSGVDVMQLLSLQRCDFSKITCV
eukprot:scaffold7.g3708.t1